MTEFSNQYLQKAVTMQGLISGFIIFLLNVLILGAYTYFEVTAALEHDFNVRGFLAVIFISTSASIAGILYLRMKYVEYNARWVSVVVIDAIYGKWADPSTLTNSQWADVYREIREKTKLDEEEVLRVFEDDFRDFPEAQQLRIAMMKKSG
jgi:tellurite resistance protein TehA-like permease